MSKHVYEKIEDVMRLSKKPLAPHEFSEFILPEIDTNTLRYTNGREYVGCSESALGRRLREMRAIGRVTAKRRDGRAFTEYALQVRAQQGVLL